MHNRSAVVLLALVLLISSCVSQRPFKRVKRHWQKIQDELVMHPELADTFKLVRVDTFKTVTFRDSVSTEVTVDSALVKVTDSLATELIAAPVESKPEVIVRIQERVCPDYKKNTTYRIKVFNSRITFWIPLNISVLAKGGRLDVTVSSDSIRIPERQVHTEVRFTPNSMNDFWKYLAIVSTTLLVLVIAIILIRFKK